MAITISDTEPRVQYTATAGQTSFTVNFEFFAVGDLKVYNGTTLLTYNISPSSASQYSVAGAGVSGGGSITLGGGATLNDVITIIRDMPVSRSTDFPVSGAFQIGSLNTELDKTIAMMQQLERDLKLTPKALPTTTNAYNIAFPNLVAGKILSVNSAGDGLEFIQDVSTAADITGVAAGTGLTGGGTAGDVTLNVIGGTGITANANDIEIDTSVVTTLTGSQTLTNKILTSPVINTGISGSAFLDEDNMASNSATKIASQQSIKAYVDAQVATVPTGDITSVVAGTGLSGGATSGAATLNLANTSVTAASYGSSTAIPTFTVDAQGRLTAAGTASISSDMAIAGDSGTNTITIGTDTFTIAGGTGLSSTATTDTITLNIDNTVATLTGSQILTGKTIDVDNNTVSNIEVDNLKSGVLDTALSSVSSNDDTLASAKAIKSYVDTQVATVPTGDITSVVAGTGLSGGATSGAATLSIDGTVATLAGTQTFTNKTIDANGTGNSITNIEVADLASGVLDTNISSVSGSDDTLASAKAIKTYVDAQVSGLGSITTFKFTVSSSTTTLSGNDDNSNSLAYTAGKVSVFLNGIRMVIGVDVTATNGTSVVFASAIGASGTDTVEIIAFSTFDIANMNASNLTSGTVPDARITGTYTGLTGLDLGDNNKIRFGDANDFEIYHSGTSSIVREASAGNLVLAGNDVQITNGAMNETHIDCNNNGSVDLYHDNSKKFETTSTGVAVTGDLTVDTNTLYVKSSNDRVGIGNSNPQNKLDISALTWDDGILIKNTGNFNTAIIADANRSGASGGILNLASKWNGTEVAGILFQTGSDTTNKDDGEIVFRTASAGTPQEKVRIDSSGNVAVNNTSPQAKMHIVKTDVGALNDANSNCLMIEHTNAGISIGSSTTGEGHIYFSDSGDADVGAMSYFHSDNSLRFRANASERMRLNSTGLGIGTTSPDAELHVGDGSGSSDNTRIRIVGGTSGHSTIQLGDSASANIGQIQYDHANNKLDFRVNSGTRATIDSSGNTHFSRTSESGVGISLRSDGIIKNEVNGNVCLSLFRTNSAGNIVAFYKDTTLTGLIGSVDGNSLVIGEGNAGIRFYGGGSVVVPRTASGGVSDNNLKFGFTSNRWHTFYAGTGSINTSDENEKQSIQSLTTAEMNVAKKLSSLIKTYKWNSSVEEKGDNARIHTGLIAQQVKQAFDDESLDASKYGFWCSDTWYVDADGEEVTEDTEGAISKTRLGLRYSELFAFIQAYNDQRFTELEARITTLENN